MKEYLDWDTIVSELRPGDRVTGLFPGGLSLRSGREYKERTGRIVIKPIKHLDNINHFVLNMGGQHGTPGVVSEENFVAGRPHKSRRILMLLK